MSIITITIHEHNEHMLCKVFSISRVTPHIRASFVYWQLYLLYIWIGRIKVTTATLAESEINGGATWLEIIMLETIVQG